MYSLIQSAVQQRGQGTRSTTTWTVEMQPEEDGAARIKARARGRKTQNYAGTGRHREGNEISNPSACADIHADREPRRAAYLRRMMSLKWY
jgi:hypothetical protein